MKTIELICGGTKAQFTTKSVTYNGVEYFYSRMTDVSHNEDEGFYTFTYNDETIRLPYEEKDSKIVAAIFNQVNMLLAKKAALQKEPVKKQAEETAEKQIEEKIEEQKPDTSECDDAIPAKSGGNTLEDCVSIRDESNTEQPAKVETDTKEPTATEDNPEVSEPEKKAEEIIEKESVESDDKQQESAADADKKKVIKKSFIIFGIIIIICAIAAAITFAAFGSSDSASQIVPKATESQQYDDIDEIINDLQ